MRTPKRWLIATLAAATVAAAGAGAPDELSDAEYQRRRERIEQMPPEEKKQLLEKKERFSGLSEEKQEELRRLHRQLQQQANCEELERVMEAYVQWVRTLSPQERFQLNRLSPEERIEQVIKYKKSPGRQIRRPGGFGGPWSRSYGGRGPGRSGFPGFFREYVEAVKNWTGRYVVERSDQLADLLPAGEREKWKATAQNIRSEDGSDTKRVWAALASWYLAGPTEDLPFSEAEIAELEKTLPPEIKNAFEEFPAEAKIRDIRDKLRFFTRHRFATDPDLKDLVTDEELDAFEKSLSGGQQDFLAHVPEDGRRGWLRGLYFESKLPEHLRDERDRRFPFMRGGGPPHGEPRRDGPPRPRRGPGGDLRERFDEPRDRERRPGFPDVKPRPDRAPGRDRR